MNITQTTINELKELYTVHFYDNNCNIVKPEIATELNIGYELTNGNKVDANGMLKPIHKTIKATKKETTTEYVLAKINAGSTYMNFCTKFNKLLDSGLNAYPTSYGIGVFVAIGFRKQIDSIKQCIEGKLTELGVMYTTEYSDAGWVFRYKISKSAANIEIITSI
jgi:hypothetical protein